MVQVLISGRNDHLHRIRNDIAAEIDGCLTAVLGYPRGRQYYRFLPLEEWQFIHPDDRTTQYTIVELTLYSGRSDRALKALLDALVERVPKALGLKPSDAEFIIYEVPRKFWALRGQIASDIELGYSLEK
jgi:hypothetical protein